MNTLFFCELNLLVKCVTCENCVQIDTIGSLVEKVIKNPLSTVDVFDSKFVSRFSSCVLVHFIVVFISHSFNIF